MNRRSFFVHSILTILVVKCQTKSFEKISILIKMVLYLKVMDPLLPLGVLSGCLSAYSGVKTVKVKRGSLDALSSIERPVSPSQQPVKIKYLSNLFKDVEEGITRIRSGSNIPSASTWWDTEISGSNIPSASTWWDTEICHHHPDSTEMIEIRPVKEKASTSQDVTIQESNSTSPEDSQEASMEFKVKLPQGFKPLRSKFCGDNFQMHQSPLVKNAFMSPALADDELVQYLPHVDIVVSSVSIIYFQQSLVAVLQ